MYKYNAKSKVLISVDIKNNQFVIFDNTDGNVYHGHVKTYKEIERDAVLKNILMKNNLIKSSGKIIK